MKVKYLRLGMHRDLVFLLKKNKISCEIEFNRLILSVRLWRHEDEEESLATDSP